MSREKDAKAGVGSQTRRGFLRQAGVAAAAVAAGSWRGIPLAGAAEAAEARKKARWAQEPKGPYAPFRMALQTYSLRKLDFQKTIDAAAFELELPFLDLWPEHFPRTLPEADVRSRIRAMRQNMLARIAWGVVELTADERENLAIFEFAQRLNVHSITAYPTSDSFDILDKLVARFGIPVAIHNHGPADARYGKPELIEKAIKGHHELIGLCVDTGHFLRSGVNPIEVVRGFKGRVHAVHLKDAKAAGGKPEDAKETVVGRGDLDLVGFLRALRETGFSGGLALEYEEEPDDPIPSMKACLAAVRDAVKKL